MRRLLFALVLSVLMLYAETTVRYLPVPEIDVIGPTCSGKGCLPYGILVSIEADRSVGMQFVVSLDLERDGRTTTHARLSDGLCFQQRCTVLVFFSRVATSQSLVVGLSVMPVRESVVSVAHPQPGTVYTSK